MKTLDEIRDDVAKMCKVESVKQDEHSVDIKLSLDLSQILEAAENDGASAEEIEQFYRDLEDAVRAGVKSAIDEYEKD